MSRSSCQRGRSGGCADAEERDHPPHEHGSMKRCCSPHLGAYKLVCAADAVSRQVEQSTPPKGTVGI
jgi:hypothetical protein